jgi:transposase
LEWAQVRALVADGVSEREIARRLGMNRRTVARLARSEGPPRYRRAPSGSQLDSLEPVLRRLLEEWPAIKAPRLTEILRSDYGYTGSLRLVQAHLKRLRPSTVRPAQRTGYRPGQVLQLDWAEMPSRPMLAGRERRVYALVASLPYSGAQTAFFSLEMTLESFLEGHVHAFEWLGGVPRECVYDNLRSVVARRDGDQVVWNPRFLHLRGHYGFHATVCTPATPREKGSVEAGVRYLKSGFWPARRFSSPAELDGECVGWRDRTCNRRTHASGRFAVDERLAEERQALRRCRRCVSTGLATARRGCRSTATCATAAASTGRRSGSCTSASRCASTAIRFGSSTAAPKSPATRAATSTASGCRRRSCAPSHRRRRRRSWRG